MLGLVSGNYYYGPAAYSIWQMVVAEFITAVLSGIAKNVIYMHAIRAVVGIIPISRINIYVTNLDSYCIILIQLLNLGFVGIINE